MNPSMDDCSFCANPCSGPFRHILSVAEEFRSDLEPVLVELKTTSLPLGAEGYQTCDKCRRRIITSYRIPESCFQIMPSSEVVSIKVEPEVDFDSLRRTDGSDDEDYELLPLEPETELRIDEDAADGFMFNGLDDRLTVQGSDVRLETLGKAPKIKAKRGKHKLDESVSYGVMIKKDRAFPIRHRCPFCNKGFSDKYLMTTHVRWHTGEKPFKCEFCDKGFCENSKLKLHRRTHTGERPYVCPYCSKSFTQSVTLKIHIRIHTRETPYVCEICNRGFTQSYNLTLHLRNQHNEVIIYRGREVGILPEYKCEHCGKIYRSPKSFQLHVKLHGAGKLFDCELCGKQYTFVHKCKVEGGAGKAKVYPCRICGQEFKHQQSVVYHMSSKHNQLGNEEMGWADRGSEGSMSSAGMGHFMESSIVS
ncbi:zinc finger protein 271 isoform X1 [Aedes aegypti]|uniref:C2H2-type domain-containing protein n=2 Tax=Aedes aegypti TaxID=7159 RepID=A0A1S4FXZ0_AEDAE|nr:zinc finger protein 271 isoform X1 [Aedes aegypti]